MYKSFIIAEALLHNPIMNAFVQLLCTRKDYNQKPGKEWITAWSLYNR